MYKLSCPSVYDKLDQGAETPSLVAKKALTAFVIVRVSAEDQLKGYGPDVQWEDDILPNAPGLGLLVTDEYRRVIQESATKWERTKFEAAVREALALYQQGVIKALLFPRVDRETRFIFGSIPLLAEVVKSGLKVYFAREKLALDPDDPESIERYLSKATQAQAYVQTMKLNTGRAKKKLLREGKLPQGTGVGLYGTTYDRMTKKRVIEPFEAGIVQEIFQRIASGDSPISIARDLNNRHIRTKCTKADSPPDQIKHWHSLTIRRMIRNPAFVGKTYFGMTTRVDRGHTVAHPEEKWVLLPDVTPAIVTDEIFNEANAQLEKPKIRTGRPQNPYPLKNHAFCAICNRPLVGHCLNKKYRYYQCSSARPYENSGKKCNATYIRADDLEKIVWDKTLEIFKNPKILLNELAKLGDRINQDALEAEIQELGGTLNNYEQRRNKLLEAIEWGEFEKDEILDRLNILKRLRSDDEVKLKELVKTKKYAESLATAHIKVSVLHQRVLDELEQSTPELKALALDALDVKVYAKGTNDIRIQGVIPLELTSPTTEQTSASQREYNYQCPPAGLHRGLMVP
ncbi:MAG: recombinase family protein [Dehalogenimonas sp.]|uniref:Recombinase family protein n=1 Tax=Candidatus Dehalogenimonas loeffleri TaxID=3127115 RepID=A0ABZ2J9R1_9CHLR|nr:recombinase family protein [Dehalogenimonas sp.]